MGHHYIPQAYLRAFAAPDDPDLIWMYDRKRHRWSKPAIEKAAQQRGYFTEDTESRLEREVESPANAALASLRTDGEWKRSHRRALAVYMSVMFKRVPRQRRRAMEMLPEALTTVTTNLRETVLERFADDPDRLRGLLAEIDAAEAKLRAKPPENVLQQIRAPWTTAQILDAVESMVWRFVRRPSSATEFITSDNPAYYFDSSGVGKPESELTFPVSPSLALVGSHQGPPGSDYVVTVPVSYAKEINRRVISGAERFIFSSRPDRWIEQVANKSEVRLNRILWPKP